MTQDKTKAEASTSELDKLINGSENIPGDDSNSKNSNSDSNGNDVPFSTTSGKDNSANIEEATVVEERLNDQSKPINHNGKTKVHWKSLAAGVTFGLLVCAFTISYSLWVKIGKLEEQVVFLSENKLNLKFYPYDDVVTKLKAQGYNMTAINQYNRNMIAILNSKGITVIPKATVEGDVPSNMVADLMSVDEMNRLANQ